MGSLNCKNCNCNNKNHNDENEINRSNIHDEYKETHLQEQQPQLLQSKTNVPIKNNREKFLSLNNENQLKDDTNMLTIGSITSPNNNSSINKSKYNYNFNSPMLTHKKDIFSNQSDIVRMDVNENDDKFKVLLTERNYFSNSQINELNEENTNNLFCSKTEREHGDEILNSNKTINVSKSVNNNYKCKSIISLSQENKIQFGIDRDTLTPEEIKLLEETQKNLDLFYPPEKNEEIALQKKLNKIELDSFIPLTKLNNMSNANEVFFHGELKKLINYELSTHKPQLYSSRFCTLTNTSFYYYKSKETYLRKQRPLCVIPLIQISNICFAKIKKTSKKVDHIIICNKMGIIKHNKEEIERCKLFQDLDFNACMNSASESGEGLIIFTSEIEQTLFKWFIVLNYLLDKVKESEK